MSTQHLPKAVKKLKEGIVHVWVRYGSPAKFYRKVVYLDSPGTVSVPKHHTVIRAVIMKMRKNGTFYPA